MKRILIIALIILFCYLFLLVFSQNIGYLLISSGFLPEEVRISGTGSMYPTFPKSSSEHDIVRARDIVAAPKMRRYPGGINLLGKKFFSYEVGYGDIVEFENEKTNSISLAKYGDQAGFVKRVIALSGDRLELRDGFVYRNGAVLDEPYTAKPRSTYGGEILADCMVFEIPSGKVFVLGDNRKASLDSRHELGLVDESDIHYVISWADQDEFRGNWRDTADDAQLAHTSTFDPQEFLKLLNEKRKKDNLKDLAFNTLLSQSGNIRGAAMLKSNDFSIEASRSGITLSASVKKSGYHNIILAELYTRGFYEAGELLDNIMEFPQSRKLLFTSDYQDIGIAAVLADVENCPTQVVVFHLGGYVPPDYSPETVAGWQKLIDNLQEVLPSWESLRSAENADKAKLERIISLLATRLSNAQTIHSRMAANKWLTDEEQKMVEDDNKLTEETNRLIEEFDK